MRRTLVLVALVSVTFLAGCYESGSAGLAGGSAPVRQELVTNRPMVVGAGDYGYNPFTINVPARVEFVATADDDSSFTVGIFSQADRAEASQGQSVSGHGVVSNTRGATRSVDLPAGSYDFGVFCNNNFADCDLTFSLTATG